MNFISQATVTDVIEHQPNIKEFVLSIEKERKYNPGSFVQLTLETVTASDIWPDSRTFSIASWEKGIMRFIIKKVGYYTSRIFSELSIGCRCTVKYPFGDLYDRNTLAEKHLFLAGGVGITPFLGMSKFFADNGLIENISLLYSVKHLEDAMHLRELSDRFGDRMQLFVTREKVNGCHCRRMCIDDIVNVTEINTNVYICGSKEFNAEIASLLAMKGYEKIHMDEWE